ncbi:hypothetical protein KFK09_017800 [Dendrobium nobile]|uniref:TF-B3 domain-containing protein n=1 Tax=Dendrobium nobile TaxID=94219 RepID=A0A8T3AU55_DENNO|nr:hypothetical protein KFK09_017800 [Dendrobium nobile]
MNGEWVLVAEKMLQASDLNTNQNRLLLRRCDAQKRLLPLLRQSELEAVMNSNGGLNIEISTANCDKVFEVQFKHWGSSKGFIFNGRGWRNLRSHFKEMLTEGNILRFYRFRGDGEREEGRDRKLQMRMVVVPSSEMMKAADILVSFRRKRPSAISAG